MSSNLAELVGIDVPTRLLIGGEWTGGRGGGTMPVIDPATEDALTEVADGTEQDALDAVDAASGALAGWVVGPLIDIVGHHEQQLPDGPRVAMAVGVTFFVLAAVFLRRVDPRPREERLAAAAVAPA